MTEDVLSVVKIFSGGEGCQFSHAVLIYQLVVNLFKLLLASGVVSDFGTGDSHHDPCVQSLVIGQTQDRNHRQRFVVLGDFQIVVHPVTNQCADSFPGTFFL